MAYTLEQRSKPSMLLPIAPTLQRKIQRLAGIEPNTLNLIQQRERASQFGHSLVQTKLSVGRPGDRYEQEADHVADQVLSMGQPQTVQREEVPEEELQMKIQRMDAPEEEEMQMKPNLQLEGVPEEEELQMKSEGTASPAVEQQLNSSKGGGSPLSEGVRSQLEPKFGFDFSQVRVHTSNSAVQMNQSLQAQAFTHGNDIFFGAGKYSPESSGGQHLLAHELTHTIQQTGGVRRHPED